MYPTKSKYHVPIGFTRKLALHNEAYMKFGTLSSEQKSKIISYITDDKNGYDTEEKMNEMIASLENETKNWYYD